MENNIMYQNNLQGNIHNETIASNQNNIAPAIITESPGMLTLDKDNQEFKNVLSCNFVEKYRIRTFDDMIGNEDAVQTLKGELAYNFIQNVKIFHGRPSSGKSSAALIQAKSINCQSPLDVGVPCEQCISCKSASVGANPDIITINAGSRNGVDTAREIEEELEKSPLYNKKVIILEEWQKMTTNALTALLTVMEKPTMSSSTAQGSHYAFIMPTTDLPTNISENAVLSRAVVVHFFPIPKEKLIERLKEICHIEGISFEDPAIDILYRNSNGAMRDCLKNLQSLATRCNFNITEDGANKFFAITSSTLGKELFNAIHTLNPIRISSIIENHSNKSILKESDFNDLSNLFLEACNNATPFMQTVYTNCLKALRDNRIIFLRDPSRKTEENLIIACNEISSLLRDNLALAVCHLCKNLNADLGDILFNLNPDIKIENGHVIFTLTPPKLGIQDLITKLNSPEVNSIFKHLGISRFEFKSIGRDICYKIATNFDRVLGETILSLNPATILDTNNELTLVINRPTVDSKGNPMDINYFESFLFNKQVGDIFISNGVTRFLYR